MEPNIEETRAQSAAGPDPRSWQAQGDGTYLPTEELLDRVYENPEAFPDAVQDFSIMSGKTEDDVRDILNNRFERSKGGVYRTTAYGAVDVAEGASRGLSIALRKTGEMTGFESLETASDFVSDISNSLDPTFDTDRSTVENITEGLGQAVPAIGAAVVTKNPYAAFAVAGLTERMTFEDEDNLIQMAEDWTDGAMPDFLIIQDGDDLWTRRIKGVASTVIADLALVGAGRLIGRVYHAVKTKNPQVIEETLSEVTEEAGLPSPVADGAVEPVINPAALSALDEVAEKASSRQVALESAKQDVVRSSAKELNDADILARSAGEVTFDVPEKELQGFVEDTMGALMRTVRRSAEVNTGSREALREFVKSPSGRQAYLRQSEEVFIALGEGRFEDVFEKINTFRTENSADFDALWRGSILRASMERVEARFSDVIERIRQDPSLQTVDALDEMTDDLFKAKIQLAEAYRQSGSAQSLGLLNRKLGITEADTELMKALDEADDVIRTGSDGGYGITATKEEFVAAQMMKLKEMGFNPTKVIDQLYRTFDEFDVIRERTLANMKDSNLAKLTKAEREKLEGSFIRMLHDLHSSALLGQPSTAGLEVMSNFINNAGLPIAQHIFGAKSLKEVPLGVRRAHREYAGYHYGFSKSWEIFKSAYARGKSVTDDFDILDAAHSDILDYSRLASDKQWARYMLVRLWKFGADISIAASEGMKAWRGLGVAYADGLELATRSGLSGSEAVSKARLYASSMLSPDGAFTDLMTRLDVQETSWQSVFDTRYATGKLAQAVDNFRNSGSPLVSIPSRAVIPFFRTLVNIGHNSAQFAIPPGVPSLIRGLNKTKLGNHALRSARFLDDFSGNNGWLARQRALGRQRMGLMMFGGAFTLAEMGQIEITGPGGYQSWDAKMERWNTRPSSSLIIGDTAIDLSRFLPFSAPILLAGILQDEKRALAMKMSNGEYPEDVNSLGLVSTYGSSLITLWYSMLSDAGALRGAGDLFDKISTAVERQDPKPLLGLGTDYLKQFTPGVVRVVGKNRAVITGEEEDWDMFRGEGFLEEVLASAGFPTGYKRLDFLGKPIRDDFRGIDPTNAKPVKINSDPLYREYAMLNNDVDLSLTLPTPDRVFDKSYWRRFGRETGPLDWLIGPEVSLTKLKTKSGENAYDRYRDLVYNGRVQKTVTSSTGRSGDRISVGSIEIREGENFEDAIRRYTGSSTYQGLIPDARLKVWKAVFGVFTKNAKDQIKSEVVVTPELFGDQSKYGSPISQPETLADTDKAAKSHIKGIQTSRGVPRSLDDVFAIE